MESDAQSGLRDHRQVVGTVAHGNGLGEIDFLNLGDELQQFGLAMAVDNLSDVASRQLAVVANLQFIGIDIVDAVLALQVLAEIGEAATEDGNLIASAG